MSSGVVLFVTLLALTNPIGNAAIFVSLTQGYDKIILRSIARKTAISIFIALLVSAFLGPIILGALGITIQDFAFAGGLILMSIGFSMFRGSADKSSFDKKEHKDCIGNMAVSPLAIPLFAGPGAMVAVIDFVHGMKFSIMNIINLLAPIALISIVCGGILYLTSLHAVQKVMAKKSIIGVITRIFGLLLISLGSGLVLTALKFYLK